jgi:hypothetical protein
MSDSVFMSAGLEDLLPEDFAERMTGKPASLEEIQKMKSVSTYVEGPVDRFIVEFLTDRENARKIVRDGLRKSFKLQQYFDDATLFIDGIEIKEPGPSLTLRGTVSYT